MCPFRVLLIFLSAAIAIFATMAAMAKDPTEEELEAERQLQASQPPKTAWMKFVDFWTGRYLYRESKRLMPWMFSKSQPETQEENNEIVDLKQLQAELDAAEASANGSISASSSINEFQREIVSLHEASAPSASMPEPSAPHEYDADATEKIYPSINGAKSHRAVRESNSQLAGAVIS